jgi:hypothetical protein
MQLVRSFNHQNKNIYPPSFRSSNLNPISQIMRALYNQTLDSEALRRKGDQATYSCRRRTATDAAPSGGACGGTSCPCVPSARKTTKTPCGGGAAGRSPMRKPSRRRSPFCMTPTRRRMRWRAAPWIPAGGGGARGDRRDPRSRRARETRRADRSCYTRASSPDFMGRFN